MWMSQLWKLRNFGETFLLFLFQGMQQAKHAETINIWKSLVALVGIKMTKYTAILQMTVV